MSAGRMRGLLIAAIAGSCLVASASAQQRGPDAGSSSAALDGGQGLRFTSDVDLVNITATVTDAQGRFVPGLTRDDFVVYEDGERRAVTHFSAERAPVSLGIVLDTSTSMAGGKIEAARAALRHFLHDLLGATDEVFLSRFSDRPVLLQAWTRDRTELADGLDGITPAGETALYDAVAAAIPVADTGTNSKKALLVISDGNDNRSRVPLPLLKERIRESELLVYAIGIDHQGRWFPGAIQAIFAGNAGDYGVNAGALRQITDDSGGRTEIIRGTGDLERATARIANELSAQYYLGYRADTRDGRWHSIRVQVRNCSCHVRARRGYFAS